jgi:cytoskeletal protein RodZ
VSISRRASSRATAAACRASSSAIFLAAARSASPGAQRNGSSSRPSSSSLPFRFFEDAIASRGAPASKDESTKNARAASTAVRVPAMDETRVETISRRFAFVSPRSSPSTTPIASAIPTKSPSRTMSAMVSRDDAFSTRVLVASHSLSSFERIRRAAS